MRGVGTDGARLRRRSSARLCCSTLFAKTTFRYLSLPSSIDSNTGSGLLRCSTTSSGAHSVWRPLRVSPPKKCSGCLLGSLCGRKPRRRRCPPFSPYVCFQGRLSCPDMISSQVQDVFSSFISSQAQDTFSSRACCLVLLWCDLLSQSTLEAYLDQSAA